MNELLAKIFRWLWNKLVVLLIVVLLLVVVGWVKTESYKLKGKLAEAQRNERLAERFEEEVATLVQKRNLIGSQLASEFKELSSLEQAHSVAMELVNKAEAKLNSVKEEERFYYTKWTHADYYVRRKVAEAAYKAAHETANATEKTWSDFKKKLESSTAGKEIDRLKNEIDQRQSDAGNLRLDAQKIGKEVAQNTLQRIKGKVIEVLPDALLVLAGVILVPGAIKAFLYFLVAPFIAKATPIVLLSESNGDIDVEPSAVSVPVNLAPGDELIVHSAFLQAAGAGPGKKTRWLLSWKMPFTSIASGLYMLVSVKNRNADESKVTISPKADLFDKICGVTIPGGASMVVYPRSLVGVILKNGNYPSITRHWRIANLHSWVTFQFRYLVVHGEARIFLKGCRGARAEQVTLGKPGMQDQLATVGFTANLAYSGVRCETFIDYLLGRDELFNDRFSGADGYFLTEETPHRNRKTGFFGRGLEGLLDGFLKAFGI